MTKINCLNPISKVGTNLLKSNYEITDKFEEAEAVLVRSAAMHDLDLPESLLAVGRAGAGVNNIPLDKCADKGIVVFNTPGANANGVKEAVIAGLLLASRDYIGGYNWVKSTKDDPNLKKLVEKQKKQFAGSEIMGKKLGVIGLGAIGVKVANVANRLGMDVYGYDPYLSVNSAWNLSKHIKHISNVEDIYKECDFITIHVPYMESTKYMINKDAIALMKDGVKVLNFARGELVNDDDMIAALESGKVSKYVTDFPDDKIAKANNTITIPHLGASTAESEDNCAVMAVNELMDYIENGNIKNSVNYPACDMGVCQNVARIAIHHKNIPNMLGQFTSLFANEGINISDMINKSKNDYAYSLLDLGQAPSEDVVNKIKAIDGVLRVRVIK
ncbi:phosphoglycerate dehydrogenase [Clostridium sp. HCP1S3_B4]|uniref:phosphoglycerate dehydrogenase n=1 Tax=unclassified Clostridium TaxID=2614128 RepID=UPI002A7D4576|nr:phosphoglycerate dehydrogenase [Clostridium sp.]